MLVSYIKALMRRFKGVDLAARLEMLSEGIRGTHSTYFLARDRESAEIVGLKLIDGDAASKYELRYGRLCGETAYSIDHPRVLSRLNMESLSAANNASVASTSTAIASVR